MNRTPNPHGVRAEQQVLLSAYAARQVPGDRQVLADDVLQAALSATQALSRKQLAMLKVSPLTLCRLRYLEALRLAATHSALATGTAGSASVHALGSPAGQTTPAQASRWQRSPGELLAAAGVDADCSLPSADGLWTLSAWTRGHATRLRLNLRRPADDDGQLSLRLDPEIEVGVLDGRGGTLLLGRLDDDGELEVLLDHPLDLRSHLAQHGGHWSVERV